VLTSRSVPRLVIIQREQDGIKLIVDLAKNGEEGTIRVTEQMLSELRRRH